MADLTKERILLLDKLYNLRSDDSIITTSIQGEINDLDNRISDTTEQKGNEVERKKDLENQLDKFTAQSSLFLENFSAYDNSSFESLKEVDIDIELGSILAKLRQSIPTHKDEIKSSIVQSEQRINDHTAHIENLNQELSAKKVELEDAENVKDSLNSLLDDILVNHNDSYNRGYIKKILEQLDVFQDEEKNSLEYLILFPENGLADFDASYSSREHGNPFEEVVEETKDEVTLEPIVEETAEESTEEPVATEIVFEPQIEVEVPTVDFPTNDTKLEEQTTEYVEEVKEEDIVPDLTVDEAPYEEKTYDIDELLGETKKEEEISPIVPFIEPSKEAEINLFASTPKETEKEKVEKEENKNSDDPYYEVKQTLEKLNLDHTKFKQDDYDSIMYLLSNTEYGVLALNAELLKTIEVNEGVIYKYFAKDNYMYLADEELSKKVSLIRSKGISDKKIKEELTSGNFTYSLNVMKDRIEALKTTGNELTEKNVGDIKADIIGFYKNILTLSDLGFELDDKEIRNFRTVLSSSPYIVEDAELLKEHLVKLVQKNGKYAMNVFWNCPKDLELGIEQLEEAGLSNLIEQNPEVLSSNSEMVVRRTNYCQEHNMPINENDDETEFCDYIVDALAFYRAFENVSLPVIPSAKENNKIISRTIGNQEYTNILVDILDNYYSESENLYKVEFTDKDLENIYSNLKSTMSGVLKCTSETDRVYDVSGILISKSKAQRNLKVLLDNLNKQNQPIDGFEKELILASALYNLRVSKEQIEMIASNSLGDKKLSKELGGLAA